MPDLFPAVNGISAGGGGNFPGRAKQRAQQLGVGLNHAGRRPCSWRSRAGSRATTRIPCPPTTASTSPEQVGIRGINVDADSSGLSRIPIAGYWALGDAFFIPLLNENTVVQGLVNVTYFKRGHALKIGADVKLRDFYAFQSPTARGQFSFSGNFTSNGGAAGTGNAIASFLLGYPSATTRSKYLAEPTYVANEFSGFIQDDWRVRPWLTLNLGVRYDYYPPLTEYDNQIANVDLAAGVIRTAGEGGFSKSAGVKPDRGNVSPRVGFAATLKDKTVIRGGYAMSFSPPFVGSPLAMRNPPFVSLYHLTPSAFVPVNRLSEGLPALTPTSALNPTGNLTPVAFDLKCPTCTSSTSRCSASCRGRSW